MNIQYRVPLAGIAVLLTCCMLFFFIIKTSSEIESLHQAPATAKAGSPVSSSDMSGIRQSLAGREYNISYDSTRQVLQSPNRRQNLRAYYRPGKLTVVPRVDTAGKKFEFSLSLEGIYADKKLAFMPDAKAIRTQSGAKLDIKHKGFTEEYINNEQGIRQNFIVEKRPAQARTLEVKLNVSGLKILASGTNRISFAPLGADTASLTYSDLKCWDAQGSELDAELFAAHGQVCMRVDVADAVFPVTIDPIIAKGDPGTANAWMESNQVDARAGYSVASAGDVNGDGYSDVLVGAPFYDKGESNEGAVFLHYGSGAGLNSIPAMILEGNQAGAQFGTTVGTAGDVNGDGYSDILIGAPLYDKGQTDEGAVFLYPGSATGIKVASVVVLESNQATAHFGQSVGCAGDVNADGFSDVLVGAPLFDKGQVDEGAVFVFNGSATFINPAISTVLEINQPGASFGNSVAGAGDVNADGFSDVVVGAVSFSLGQTKEGGAFIYHGSAAGVQTTFKLKLEGNQNAAAFGCSVSTAGDVNGDGFSDIIIGANNYSKGEEKEGVAFVYHGSAAGIVANAMTTIEANQQFATLGNAVACAGDVNGDGYSDVIVGAPYYDNGQNNEGAAFVYHGTSNGISATIQSQLEANQPLALMGGAVGSAGDVNGDGYSDVLVGASYYDKGQNNEGGAFVFQGGAYTVDLVTSTSLVGGQNGAQFGWSVASAGDINGDGFGDIIIGANEYDNGQADEGAAFIYYGSRAGLDNASPTMLEIDKPLSAFGSSVASAGDVNGDGYGDVVVGAYLYDNVNENAGAVFVFHGSKNGIIQTIQFKAEGAQVEDYMGKSVSSAGDVNADGFDDIIVGAPGYDLEAAQFNEGVAFVFNGSSDGVTQSTRILAGDTRGFYFGSSVATIGDCNSDGFSDVIVGSPSFSQDEDNEGAVFVYHGSPSGPNFLPDQTLESGQNGARLGSSVAAAGDVNGDGLPDFVAGADRYTNGEYQEGACFVYYADATGFFKSPEILERNFMGALFGSAVQGAGDLNGDGYKDVIIGGSGYTNEQPNEGSFYVYLGSHNGLSSGFLMSVEGNQEGAFLGHSVASAGDINGDGYNDILIGAHRYDQTVYNEGIVFVAYGNTGASLRNNLRIYNSDLISPINASQFAKNEFGAGLYAKSFLGKNKGKLVWETKAKGQAFSKPTNALVSNSTQFSGMQNMYASLGATGTELKNVIAKNGTGTKVRTRVRFDPVLALTGQVYGPWRYTQASLSGLGNSPAREQAQHGLQVTKMNVPPRLVKIEIFPNPASTLLAIRSTEGIEIEKTELLNANGKMVLQSSGSKTIDVSGLRSGKYILKLTDVSGAVMSKSVVIAH